MTEEIREQETEVVTQETQEIATIGQDVAMPMFKSDKEMVEFTMAVERRNQAIDTMVQCALKHLLPTDFVDFQDHPLLQGTGAQRLIKYFSISVRNIVRIPARGYEQDDNDKTRYRVTFRGEFSLGSMSVIGEGIRDTHNKLLCKTSDGYKNFEEIEIPDLDRGAKTAMYRDGVSTLLGLKSLTWAYLNELGFNKDGTTSVTYKTGSRGGDMSGSQEGKNLKTEIWRMLLEMYNKDEAHCKEKLELASRWTNKKGETVAGKTDVSFMSDAQTKVVYGKIKKDYDEYLKSVGGEQKPIDEIPF